MLQRIPWLMILLQIAWRRLRQPWITAGALAAIFNDQGQLLIVEHVFHPRVPWGLPGGWMNRDETPEQTIIREVREETALSVIVDRPLLIATSPMIRNHLDIAFLCRAQPGTVTLSAELLSYRWVDPRDPPPMLSFHRRVVVAALAAREPDRSALETFEP